MYGRNRGFAAAESHHPPAFMVPAGVGIPRDLSDVFNANDSVPSYNAVWLYLDLETSGLDPTAPLFGILEIAAVVVDNDFTVVDTFHVIIHQSEEIIGAASRWCAQHFQSRFAGGNDLYDQSRASEITEEAAGIMLRDFIMRHSAARRSWRRDPESERRAALLTEAGASPSGADDRRTAVAGAAESDAIPQHPQQSLYRVLLAGCSVYFDRHVLLTRYPYLRAHIAHKTVDLTSVLEIVRKFRPDLLPCLRPPQSHHRALADAFESLNVMRWFHLNVMMR